MSVMDAVEYVPDKPTYAIRIYSSFHPEIMEFPLISDPLYRKIAEYVFDDNDKFFQAGRVTIDSNLARSIVTDFSTYRDKVQALLVHCTMGKNRSPAVAIALNEIFGLGHNTEALLKKYQACNRSVYAAILDAGMKR